MDSKKLEDLIDKQGLYKLNSIMFDALGRDKKCKQKQSYSNELEMKSLDVKGYILYGCNSCDGYNTSCRCYIK